MTAFTKTRFGPAMAPVAAVLAIGTASPAAAHPHLWIDVTATVVFDAQGRMTALETRWTFDEIYTAFATEGMDTDGDGLFSSEELAPLAAENVKQLAEWNYFAAVEAGGKLAPILPVTTYAMTSGDGKLTLDMTLTLKRPVDPMAAPPRFAFFDPTYYIDMSFARDAPLELADAPAGCRARIDTPESASGTVVADEIATAMKADPEKPLTSLGARFAEWVSLICTPETAKN